MRKTGEARTWLLLLPLLLAAGICGIARIGLAQSEFSGLPELGVPVFYADAAVFKGVDGPETRIEVYYKIFNPNLTYVRREKSYFANYEIDAVLRGEHNPQVSSVSHSESYTVESYKQTRDKESYLVNRVDLTAPAGKYKLDLTLTDRISHKKFSQQIPVVVPDFPEDGYSLSTPLFAAAVQAGQVPDKFIKYGRPLIPSVVRAYGGNQEEVPVYLEVYSPPGDTTELMVLAKSFQRRHRQLRIDTLRFIPEATGRSPLLLAIPTAEFDKGQCEFTLTLSDGQNVLAKGLQTSYEVVWSLAYQIKNDWETVVDQLVYIAQPSEEKQLRKVPPERRMQAFDAFWASKDPTPDTPENEARIRYYWRIQFTDRHFTNPYRRGWQTDFGMVYIKYGEPDQVERYPFELAQKPYEIWYYYAQGRKFIFVDSRGNDDYQLQYPFDGLY